MFLTKVQQILILETINDNLGIANGQRKQQGNTARPRPTQAQSAFGNEDDF